MTRLKITAKVCILGNPHSGKSTFAMGGSLLRTSYMYSQPVGVNLYHHGPFVAPLPEIALVNLIVWELTLNNHQHRLRDSYLRGCSAAIIMCDMAEGTPFADAAADAAEVRKSNPSSDIYWAASKTDLVPNHDFTTIENDARQSGVRFAKLSARQGIGVDKLYLDIVQRIAMRATQKAPLMANPI